jgi:hypothetical protein
MTLQSQLTADFQHLQGELGEAFVFDGESCTGIKTAAEVGEILEIDGERYEHRFSLNVLAADFSTMPAAGDTITLGGATYRVLRRMDRSLGVVSKIDIGERYA